MSTDSTEVSARPLWARVWLWLVPAVAVWAAGLFFGARAGAAEFGERLNGNDYYTSPLSVVSTLCMVAAGLLVVLAIALPLLYRYHTSRAQSRPASSEAPTPGWMIDPDDGAFERWWDGSTWGEQRRAREL